MLKTLDIKNLTVFSEARLTFASGLNVIVGENGAGKTHLLKLAYSVLATSWEEGRKPQTVAPTKTLLQTRLADKLINVFRPETLGRLARRKQGRERCDIAVAFKKPSQDITFSFATNSQSEVSIEKLPKEWIKAAPVYLPTRELLSVFPNFVAVYEGRYLEFEETWRDTCLLLGAPLRKGPREAQSRELLDPIERAMGGSIELDRNGRFYLKTGAGGRIEMPLVAEGLRKLGMIARLIAAGALLDKGCLFWDEPEANLNPRLIKEVARSIVDLCRSGLQVIIATHSLFLLRELDIILANESGQDVDHRFFGLHFSDDGVVVEQGPSVDDIGDIASLDEELAQSDRFLAKT
ncbi:MAG: ATP-binding protein [Candidatus Sericytochromatia bacterium]|nr:ATP-binding protein [Candidatus Sericytochromatia bacterium]